MGPIGGGGVSLPSGPAFFLLRSRVEPPPRTGGGAFSLPSFVPHSLQEMQLLDEKGVLALLCCMCSAGHDTPTYLKAPDIHAIMHR
mmetsp:Transcript_29337/g.41849  ORF Transcript_29337/g.41849 Transcript_29337/m.41849 type:complete len:86 (-) Transcript_29337:76-333(-)